MGQSLGTGFIMAVALGAAGVIALQPAPVQAQSVVGVVGVAITGRALLNDAERRVNQKLAEVENQANGLMAQAITGITMAIQSARINGEALLDKPLAQLKDTERATLFAIRDATSGLDELASRAYRLEEVANVDAAVLMAGIPWLDGATFISSIRGLSLLQTKSEHKVTVIGTGLGPGSNTLIGNLEVWDGNNLLTPSRIDASQHNTTTLYFPAATFASHFAADKVVTLPLTVKLKTTRSRWYWRDVTKELSNTVPFTLYPPLMGNATVTAEVPVFAWVPSGSDKQAWTMRDCGDGVCGKGGVREERTATPGVEGNTPTVGFRRLANANCTCGEPWWAPESCQYSNALSCEIANNAKEVKHSWQVTGIWGTRTANWTVETYRRTGTAQMQLSSPVIYGQSFSFCIPSTVDLYRVEVKTLTNEAFHLVPQESVPGRIEHVTSFTCNANDKRIEYRVPAPV